ncbi:Aste57867_17502 [Aphanomyces stellatus]|uniref:Aste57867_17502 protein n=1 Tax=Aphanomyces stellatus TaxID=120398 RepID=A0A485L815_9STRA|nr:hypothetical protein As57867_017442 [Aphanomyces stellatus]VFT94255.1 Aste57867_17502 [Aphanomyces stellatus]
MSNSCPPQLLVSGPQSALTLHFWVAQLVTVHFSIQTNAMNIFTALVAFSIVAAAPCTNTDFVTLAPQAFTCALASGLTAPPPSVADFVTKDVAALCAKDACKGLVSAVSALSCSVDAQGVLPNSAITCANNKAQAVTNDDQRIATAVSINSTCVITPANCTATVPKISTPKTTLPTITFPPLSSLPTKGSSSTDVLCLSTTVVVAVATVAVLSTQ